MPQRHAAKTSPARLAASAISQSRARACRMPHDAKDTIRNAGRSAIRARNPERACSCRFPVTRSRFDPTRGLVQHGVLGRDRGREVEGGMKRTETKRERDLANEVDDLRRQLATAQATIKRVREALDGKPSRPGEIERFDFGRLRRSQDYQGTACGRCEQPVSGQSIFDGRRRFHPACDAAYQASLNAAANANRA